MKMAVQDKELQAAVDYSAGQKEAAYRVLGEYSEHIRIIGGWVPALLYPDSDHIGSIDVDVLLDQQQIRKAES